MKSDTMGCIGIIICLIIVGAIVSPLVEYIGDLALPIIILGGIGLAFVLKNLWDKK